MISGATHHYNPHVPSNQRLTGTEKLPILVYFEKAYQRYRGCNELRWKPAVQEDPVFFFSSFLRSSPHFQYSYCLHAEDFARVHNVVGVDRRLDCAHHAHRLAMLGDQEVDLAVADAVLAGAGAVE